MPVPVGTSVRPISPRARAAGVAATSSRTVRASWPPAGSSRKVTVPGPVPPAAGAFVAGGSAITGSSRPTSPADDASTQASTATPATTSTRPAARRPTRARPGGGGGCRVPGAWVVGGSRIRPAYPPPDVTER
jgi:hypothetical protein